MSIFVSGLRQAFGEPEANAIETARRQCGLSAQEGQGFIYRVSIDARRGHIFQVYTVRFEGVECEHERVSRLQNPQIRVKDQMVFAPIQGSEKLHTRPVVVGFGPAGLFAAYILARYGYRPLVLERGDQMEDRDKAVRSFWSTGVLDENSNIQFGEGGAGAYSDGKLTTRIGDPLCDEVLRVFVQFGAPQAICKMAKPHIGTDVLKNVVRALREEILRLGGEVRFRCAVTGIQEKNGELLGFQTEDGELWCEQAILAIGHSARDTFFQLYGAGVYMEPKPFSVGVRIEHLQEEINRALYGRSADIPGLPPAEYALSYRENGRACYSFCMCPGGHVVAAQSERNTVVTNGMSFHARNGCNANAALAISVNPEDFDDATPLGGVAFQRRIERAAFQMSGGYRAPCQTVGDFFENRLSKGSRRVQPTYPMGVEYGRIDACFPDFVTRSLHTGLRAFGKKIHGFDAADALLTAPETRTSSPVRLTRGTDFYSKTLNGLIPCGEGAGYAGGIMSAAVDGIRAALRILEQYAPVEM